MTSLGGTVSLWDWIWIKHLEGVGGNFSLGAIGVIALKEWSSRIVIGRSLHHELDNGVYINLLLITDLGHTQRKTSIKIYHGISVWCSPWGMPGQGGPGRRKSGQLYVSVWNSWIRQVLTTKSEKVWRWKQCVLNNTSPRISHFYLPDLLIDLSDLHCDKSPHPDLCPVPILLLPTTHNCANREAIVLLEG